MIAALFAILAATAPALALDPPVTLPGEMHAGDGWSVIVWRAGFNEWNGGTHYLIHRREGVADYSVVGTTYVDSTGQLNPNDRRVFWDHGLVGGQEYTYVIQVVGDSSSAYSSAVKITPTSEAEPFGTVFTQAGNGYVRLSWNATPFPGESNVSIYRIFRATDAGGPWIELPSVESASVFLDDDVDHAVTGQGRQPLVNLTRYFYMVFPCCPDRLPSFVSATPYQSARGAGTAAARGDSAGPRAVRLTWDPAIAGDYRPVSCYAVFRSEDGGGTLRRVDSGTGVCGLSCVDTGVPMYGKRYLYIIRPIDSAGNLGDAYPTVLFDMELPANRLFLNRNKFRPPGEALNIHFQITEPGRMRISVFSLTGELVCRLQDREHTGNFTPDTPFNSSNEGLPPVVWDGANSSGELVASGVYLVVLEINKGRDIRTVAVVR